MKMFKTWLGLGVLAVLAVYPVSARADERVALTYIVASNQGSDFDLDNDAYRDQIIRLFSYKSYRQVDQELVSLQPGYASESKIPGDYTLHLQLISESGQQSKIHATIKKQDVNYVDTVVTVEKPGVVFLGGPPTPEGVLIIVLEMGF